MGLNFYGDRVKAIGIEEAKKRLLARGLQIQALAVDKLEEAVYSSPESPAYRRTGQLKKLKVTQEETTEAITVKIGPSVGYGPFVEEGTHRRHTKEEAKAIAEKRASDFRSREFGSFTMPPRPFLRPSLEIVTQAIKSEGL